MAFVAYHDLRAAIRCHHTLARELAAMGLSQEQRPVIAHYSIMLNAANTPRDGILLVRDLQASSVTESDVQAVFSSYGQLKNVHRRMLASAGGAVIFMVEYYDLQDAKLAVYELSASTPWGHGVRVEEAERPDKERQLGQQLLLTLHRWRAEQRATFPRISTFMPNMEDAEDPGFATSPQSAGSNLSPPQLMYFKVSSAPLFYFPTLLPPSPPTQTHALPSVFLCFVRRRRRTLAPPRRGRTAARRRSWPTRAARPTARSTRPTRS